MALLYQAYASRFGIAVRSNQPEKLLSKLRKEKERLMDTDLAVLALRLSPSNPGDVWIVKVNAETAIPDQSNP